MTATRNRGDQRAGDDTSNAIGLALPQHDSGRTFVNEFLIRDAAGALGLSKTMRRHG
jgi:hypothetical protein